MKKLLVLAGILLPLFSSAQSITTKDNLISYYEDLGYRVYDDYDFTMRKGEEKELDRYFYSGVDYVVLLVPTEEGVQDSDIKIEYSSSGNVFKQANSEYRWEKIPFRLTYDRTLKVKVKCYEADYANYDYDFSLVILGR